MASAALAWVGLSEERCIKGSPGFEGRLPLRGSCITAMTEPLPGRGVCSGPRQDLGQVFSSPGSLSVAMALLV